MNRPEDRKKAKNNLGDKSGRPDLFGRDIAQMRLENVAPNIKKRAETKKNKSSKPDPAGHMVESDPAHMMIPGDDITFCLRIAASLHA